MSKPAGETLTSGRLSILFQAQLRVDPQAASAWTAHKAEEEWDHVVAHAMEGAIASAAARAQRAGQAAPSVAFRHVRGGVADATAAASQLATRDAGIKVLLAYVGGPGQAATAQELGAALAEAVTGSAELAVYVGDWQASLGHYGQWEKVWSAFAVRGPDAPADEDEHVPHPVLDRLAPPIAPLPGA